MSKAYNYPFSCGHTTYRVTIHITPSTGEKSYYRTWTGSSVKSIRSSAKEFYKNAKLRFGVAFTTNHYGAH